MHRRWPAWTLASSLACAAANGQQDPKPATATPEGGEPVANRALTEATPAEPTPTAEPAPPLFDPSAPPGFQGPPLRSEITREGLEIHDYTLGDEHGPAAASGATVRIHYVGRLVGGLEFDSTHARATPFEYELGAGLVIAGLERGLEGARPGTLRKLVIPPSLGYGERGVGPIPAMASLIFYVEVLEVIEP